MKPLIFIFVIFAVLVAWAFTLVEDSTQALNPRSLFNRECNYLSAETLNTIFDERPEGLELSQAVEKDDWEFNLPGVWSEDAFSCTWDSSNIAGLSIVISTREFLAGQNLDNTDLIPPFIKEVDPFGSIDRRLVCFRPADKAAILHTSNYGEGGIAMTWSVFATHVHVIAENESNPDNIQIRIDTELEAEWVLAQHILKRFESFREENRSQVIDSGERDTCT